MDNNTDILVQHTKTIVAGSAVYFGFTLSEWAAVFAIIFAIVNTIAILPSTFKAVRDMISKWRNRGSK